MKHLQRYNEFIVEASKGKWYNRPRPITQVFGMLPRTVDYRLLEHILTWGKYFAKSPYGHSYYSKDKTWDKTIDGTYRFSDHWNFQSDRMKTVHSVTNQPVENNTHWTIAQYIADTNTWDVVMSYPLDDSEQNINKRKEIKLEFFAEYNKDKDYDEMQKDLTMLKSYMKEGNLSAKLINYVSGKVVGEYNGEVIVLKNKRIRIKAESGEEFPFRNARFMNSDITFFNRCVLFRSAFPTGC